LRAQEGGGAAIAQSAKRMEFLDFSGDLDPNRGAKEEYDALQKAAHVRLGAKTSEPVVQQRTAERERASRVKKRKTTTPKISSGEKATKVRKMSKRGDGEIAISTLLREEMMRLAEKRFPKTF